MISLTQAEFGLLQLSIEALQQQIAKLRLNLVVERDFHKLTAVLRESQVGVINPTFDPDRNPIGRDDFWLNVTDEDNSTVACIAARFFVSENFTNLAASGTLFDPRGLRAFVGDEPVEILETSRRIHGLINYAGGLWVRGDWRKQGLSLILPYLSRSLAIRNFGADFTCGYHLRSLALSPLPLKVYGYAHQELSYRGHYPPAGGYEEMHLAYVDLEESLGRIRGLPAHRIYPIAMFRDPDLRIVDPIPLDDGAEKQRELLKTH